MNAKEKFGRNILEPKTIPQLEENLRKLESIGKGMGDMAVLCRQVIAEKRLRESRQ